MNQKNFNPNDWLGEQVMAPCDVAVPVIAPRDAESSPVRRFSSSPILSIPASKSNVQSDGQVVTGSKSKVQRDSSGLPVDLEPLVALIESQQLDLTATYADWRDIGFALSDGLGEEGRGYFHRLSRFYPRYSVSECDRQYDACLKSHGHGITMKTFFHLAKQAGIPIASPSPSPSPSPLPVPVPSPDPLPSPSPVPDPLPTFPDAVYRDLPAFLQQVVRVAAFDEERDILLLGSLVTLSACFPQLYGIYDGKRVFPNLYLFVTAQASAGKGRLLYCKQLVRPIHRLFREQARQLRQQYESDLLLYNEQKGKGSTMERPVRPPEKMLLIPANNSTTGLFQLLSDNDGRGLLFETEGDTMAQAFKTDYSNYSDGFRKAFHHETISYYRRTDREYVDIEQPCLSGVFSGTPKQVTALIPSAENGLFSRFIFYRMNIRPEWKDVFSDPTDHGMEEYFDGLGKEFFGFYRSLEDHPEILFSLDGDQQQQFNHFFQQIQEAYLCLQGPDYLATIRRLGLIAFRMMMVLTALRIPESGELPATLTCDPRDFDASLAMVKVLVRHASQVFSELPGEKLVVNCKSLKERFFAALPERFCRREYMNIAAKIGLPAKTAECYVTDFCKTTLLVREKKGFYLNPGKIAPQGIEGIEETRGMGSIPSIPWIS